MHVIYLNPLEELNIRKDSSLLLAHTAKKIGLECLLCFEDDLYLAGTDTPLLQLYEFDSETEKNSYYLKKFELGKSRPVRLRPGDALHFRLDPPFDDKYLKILWMLRHLEDIGIRIFNSPQGLLLNNEKLLTFKRVNHSVLSFVGRSLFGIERFLEKLKHLEFGRCILKPLDGFSGIGVKRLDINARSQEEIEALLEQTNGPLMIQPYLESVEKGELRAAYFKGELLGTILKMPKDGEFLTNIAQGASFKACSLPEHFHSVCETIAWDLKEQGVDLIGFDLLGDKVTEVNITCPGLLVEVSEALSKNLCERILKDWS